MKIKEQALIDAVDRLGPSWSPSHPLLIGIWATFLVTVAGAVLGIIQAAGRGGRTWPELYAPMQIGIYLCYAIAMGTMLVLWVRAVGGLEEKHVVQPFVLSSVATMAAVIAADVFFGAALLEAMQHWVPLVGTR